jgi:hypothetical protein
MTNKEIEDMRLDTLDIIIKALKFHVPRKALSAIKFGLSPNGIFIDGLDAEKEFLSDSGINRVLTQHGFCVHPVFCGSQHEMRYVYPLTIQKSPYDVSY